MSPGLEGVEVRLARPDELEQLPELERIAARAFAPWGLDVLFSSATTPIDVFRAAQERGHLLVAVRAGVPIGFAMISRVDWHAHLDELDVHPDHARQGVGRALVEAALALARSEGRTWMTLATMRAIPFNGPWYERLGFRELAEDELGPGLRTILRGELAGGYPRVDRVILGRDL